MEADTGHCNQAVPPSELRGETVKFYIFHLAERTFESLLYAGGHRTNTSKGCPLQFAEIPVYPRFVLV